MLMEWVLRGDLLEVNTGNWTLKLSVLVLVDSGSASASRIRSTSSSSSSSAMNIREKLVVWMDVGQLVV